MSLDEEQKSNKMLFSASQFSLVSNDHRAAKVPLTFFDLSYQKGRDGCGFDTAVECQL
jgi:hypothetical protein